MLGMTVSFYGLKYLLGQMLFDFTFALFFGVLLHRKAENRWLFFITLIATTGAVFAVVYLPFLV